MFATGLHDHEGVPCFSAIGYTGGIITTHMEDQDWLGAHAINSAEAERCGVILALLWCMQFAQAWDLPICIHFDCTSAGHAANGQWRLTPNSLTSQVARSLGQAAQELFGDLLTFGHVHGHANVPGNEVVDSIAKAIAKQLIDSPANNIDARKVVHTVKDHGSWLWFGFSKLRGRSDVPDPQSGLIDLPRNSMFWDGGPTVCLDPFERKDPQNGHHIFLNIGSANVRSLFEGESEAGQKTRFTEKGRYLADQFNWYGYSIVGLQETCVKHTGVSKIGNYLRLIGGANESGQLGCEIWMDENLGGHRLTMHSHWSAIIRTPVDSLHAYNIKALTSSSSTSMHHTVDTRKENWKHGGRRRSNSALDTERPHPVL